MKLNLADFIFKLDDKQTLVAPFENCPDSTAKIKFRVRATKLEVDNNEDAASGFNSSIDI